MIELLVCSKPWTEDLTTGFWNWEISWLEFTVYPNPYHTPKGGLVWEWSNNFGTIGRAKTLEIAKRFALLHAQKMLHELGTALEYEHDK